MVVRRDPVVHGVESPHRPGDPGQRRWLRFRRLARHELLGRVASNVGALLAFRDDVPHREADADKRDRANRARQNDPPTTHDYSAPDDVRGRSSPPSPDTKHISPKNRVITTPG